MCWKFEIQVQVGVSKSVHMHIPILSLLLKIYITMAHAKTFTCNRQYFYKKSYFDMTESGMHKFRQPVKND